MDFFFLLFLVQAFLHLERLERYMKWTIFIEKSYKHFRIIWTLINQSGCGRSSKSFNIGGTKAGGISSTICKTGREYSFPPLVTILSFEHVG